MTDAQARRTRLPKRWVRVIAWLSGATAFFSALSVVGASPKPASSAAPRHPAAPRRVIVRRIVRRVVIVDPSPRAPVVSVPSAPVAPSGSSLGGSSPPPPPATTSTGGSHS